MLFMTLHLLVISVVFFVSVFYHVLSNFERKRFQHIILQVRRAQNERSERYGHRMVGVDGGLKGGGSSDCIHWRLIISGAVVLTYIYIYIYYLLVMLFEK